MNRLLLGVAVPLFALTAVAGCNNDSETKADDASSSSAEESPSAEGSPGSGEASGQPDTKVDPDAPGADSEYCKLLGSDFASMFASIQGPEDVDKAIGLINDVADAAPKEVADDWSTMSGALGSMQTALGDAAELQKRAEAGEVPKKELERETTKLMKQMEALNTPENNKAGDAVAAHATEYCGIQLG